jgi:hypothetical protein
MAEVGVSAPPVPPVTDVTNKDKEPAHAPGLVTPEKTPEGTPDPNPAASQNANGQQIPEPVESQAGPNGQSQDGNEEKGATPGKSEIHENKSESANDAQTKGAQRSKDGMDTEPTEPQDPTEFHRKIYEECSAFLAALMENPTDPQAIRGLETANNSIRAYNLERGWRSDLFLVEHHKYIEAFEVAYPYRALLKVQRDEFAKQKMISLNTELVKYGKERHYPHYWYMSIPEPPKTARQPQDAEPTKSAREQTTRQPQDSRSTTAPSGTSGGSKYRKTMRQPGFVVDRGVLKEIAHWHEITIGITTGYQLMLKEKGENGYDIYEMVRASKFGVRFGKRVAEMLGNQKKLVTGRKEELRDKWIEDICIAGVAPVRRYQKNEPKGGWQKETKMFILAGFGEKPQLKWYYRSVLGGEFGQEAIDEEIDAYRKDAGQERPLAPTKRGTRKKKKNGAVASDDEDEGSIPLGEEDTSDDEDGDDEDDEDYEDEGALEDDQAELQILLKHVNKLKERMKKKRGEPANGGSTSSQRPSHREVRRNKSSKGDGRSKR